MINKLFNNQRYNQTYNQNGSTLIFFVLFVIPTLSFLLMITFDVASLYTAKRSVQKILDEASLQGVKFYPYKDYALNITRSYLLNHGLEEKNLEIIADDTGIRISYRKNYEMLFSNLTKFFVGGNGKSGNKKTIISYPLNAFSYATPSVSDVLLLLDRNSYNSPNDKKNLWGSVGEAPSAMYFEQNDDKFTSSPRYYTQQCFNEVFSPLKNILIDTYNFYGSTHLNSVGVGVFPGGSYKRDIEYIKNISAASFLNNEAKFLYYTSDDGFKSLDCFNAALNELQEIRYRFPLVRDDYKIINNLENNSVEDGKASVLTSIWSTPVHKGYKANFINVLESAGRTLISAKGRADRNTLSEDLNKNLFIFSSNLPTSDLIALETSLDGLDEILKGVNFKLNIIYVLFQTNKVPGLSSASISKHKTFIKRYNKKDKTIKLFLLHQNSSEKLSDDIRDFIWLNKKEGSIWR